MNTKLILGYLKNIAANNNRQWYLDNKKQYLAARQNFEQGVGEAITRIATFDESIAHLQVKDCVYRFNRDTRFSPDKSPYKNHLGAYIAAHGKKSLHGGYYLHLEPGQCMVACGNYWLPTNILTSCRNEIMANEESWLNCVTSPAFLKFYGASPQASWEDAQGFGLSRLKTCPTGFPKDYAYIDYLRMKDYCCWHRVDDDFFEGDTWLDRITEMFMAAKPMMDFMNNVIDDYE